MEDSQHIANTGKHGVQNTSQQAFIDGPWSFDRLQLLFAFVDVVSGMLEGLCLVVSVVSRHPSREAAS
jgi:hypothetical protein